ncbi:hypothetical protein C0993_009612 [Termitomyces sp. T159_Od127]|nr:hypothetical protein C0993_009612 [Termitomyces sp. T159_Od127]
MDSLKKAFNTSSDTNEQNPSGGGSGGMMDKINSSMGGGQAGEKNEDLLDKGMQRMGGGQQSNESAFEQAKDEQISDAIRSKYKSTTGKDFPIADK